MKKFKEFKNEMNEKFNNVKERIKNTKLGIKIRKKIECRKLKKIKKEEREIIEGKVEVIN